MFPVGGVGVMLIGIALSGVVCALFAVALRPRFGLRWSVSAGLLMWSLAVIGLITLIPANGVPGIVPAEGRLTECSRDIGGPAPEGFWIFAGGQRLLNTLVFVPSGILLVLVAARWRSAWVTVPLGLVALAAYSTAIEYTQLAAARIDRACDVTDIIDNVTGAVIGVLIGIALLPILLAVAAALYGGAVTGPEPRANVGQIPAYVPGKPPVPRPGRTSYKLSSNENPYPPLPGVIEAANRAVETMNRYPDMGNTALYDALAARLGVPVSHLAAATGSVALIYQLLAAYCEPGDEVVHAWRSFEAYPIAIAAAAAVSVKVPVDAAGRHDLGAMAAAITDRTKVVMVCTPNNPTGPAVTQTELDGFLARVPEHVVAVVDEAYVEFVRMDDAVDGLATYRSHPNVVVFRTFSKAYGLAGFRVGYAVADDSIAGALRAVSLPFGVSGVAQAAAVASLDAEPELLKRVDALLEDRARVTAGLRDASWDVPEAQGNFFWFELGARTTEFAAAAEERGIVVRPFAGEGCRASLGEAEANDRLLELAAAFPP